ncbi:MAG: adenylate/guanylate cyclase domain-containing protein [Flavobacteriales bacterium]|nr:adenylate/guanylate cyclase domain-containing protein [Flavobacteriales bacterium]
MRKAILVLLSVLASGAFARTALRIDSLKWKLHAAEQAREFAMAQQLAADLKEAYQGQGDLKEAFSMYTHQLRMRDSMDNREALNRQDRRAFQKEQLADSVANEQAKRSEAFKHAQVIRAERNQRNLFMFGGIGVLFMTGGLWFGLRSAKRSREAIRLERKVSEDLLLNILPQEIADELKVKGHADAKLFEQATILFSDFKGFTALSEELTPEELVEELNICFKTFDGIVTARGIEKIKTIDDAYMCAGGLPDPASSTPLDVILAALEMQDFMKKHKAEREAEGGATFEMRLGIHTGPVVAGIVGVKKFAYDIWGDTVNTASRMESSGEVGQVNISEATYALVKGENRLTFTPRGKVQAKGKGELDMYFVQRS